VRDEHQGAGISRSAIDHNLAARIAPEIRVEPVPRTSELRRLGDVADALNGRHDRTCDRQKDEQWRTGNPACPDRQDCLSSTSDRRNRDDQEKVRNKKRALRCRKADRRERSEMRDQRAGD